MTKPKDPGVPRVVDVRDFVDTSSEPVEVAGTVMKAEKVDDALAKRAKRPGKKD